MTSRQDALDHAAERGVATAGNFVAFTGASGTPKVETATNFTPATNSRIQRNWVFIPVGAGAVLCFRYIYRFNRYSKCFWYIWPNLTS